MLLVFEVVIFRSAVVFDHLFLGVNSVEVTVSCGCEVRVCGGSQSSLTVRFTEVVSVTVMRLAVH